MAMNYKQAEDQLRSIVEDKSVDLSAEDKEALAVAMEALKFQHVETAKTFKQRT